MTLAEDIITDVDDVFLNDEEFAVDVEFWPRGEGGSKETGKAVLVFDWLPGSNEEAGDGVTEHRDGKRADRASGDIHIKTGAFTVSDPQDPERADKFKILSGLYAGQIVVVQRMLGHDPGMMQLRVIKPGNKARHRVQGWR